MAKQDDNRVLSRRGARLITAEETVIITGAGIHTNTACTLAVIAGSEDGDVGECGH
jgi:hypothetical protein